MNLEIDEGVYYIGFKDALSLILSKTEPTEVDKLSVLSCAGYVVAEDVTAQVNSPTDDNSLQDGCAVKSQDVAAASPEHPAKLRIAGSVFAGGRYTGRLSSGEAIKICSGSPVPEGTESIFSSEFCAEGSSDV